MFWTTGRLIKARRDAERRRKNDAGNATPDNRPHTHAAWLVRGVERGALQFLRAMSPEELADRHHLSMGRWVVFQLAKIAAFGEYLSIVHDDGTEGIVTATSSVMIHWPMFEKQASSLGRFLPMSISLSRWRGLRTG